jgi:formate dehydrogenase subunit gamma
MLLWYGEQDTRFRLGGTVYLHDTLMYVSVVIVAGHLYLALVHPVTRHALRGITLGTVREDWARAHHAKWQPSGLVVQGPAEARQGAVRSETSRPQA